MFAAPTAGLRPLQTSCLLIVVVPVAYLPVLKAYVALHDLQATTSCGGVDNAKRFPYERLALEVIDELMARDST